LARAEIVSTGKSFVSIDAITYSLNV